MTVFYLEDVSSRFALEYFGKFKPHFKALHPTKPEGGGNISLRDISNIPIYLTASRSKRGNYIHRCEVITTPYLLTFLLIAYCIQK
jgi:hypothetical protein